MSRQLDKANAERLLVELQSLHATMPRLEKIRSSLRMSDRNHMWFGNLKAVLVEAGLITESVFLESARRNLLRGSTSAADEVRGYLFDALTHVERQAPARSSGGFIAVGGSFTAMAAMGRVFGAAKSTLLLVDRYMDHTILTEFALLAQPGVRVQLLSSKGRASSLNPAITRWRSEHLDRPLEVRFVDQVKLHDRLIFCDDIIVWNASQSFKDFAQKSPATLTKFTDDIVGPKVEFYRMIWSNGVAV